MTLLPIPAARSFALALCLIAAFAAAPLDLRAQGTGEAVAIPGSRVSLIPPEEFYLSDLFSGFFHDASTSSIVVTELPADAYAQVEKAFIPGMQANGINFEARSEMTVDGRPGFLLRGTQELQGTTFDKWMLIFGAEEFTGMIVISAPKTAEMPEEMSLAVLNSTKILSGEGYDPRSNLSFVFQETGEFELHAVMQGNSASLKSNKDERVLYLITASTGVTCGSLKGKETLFSEQAIRSVATITVSNIGTPEEIMIDGLSGVEQLADGVDEKSNEELAVYHATLFEDCRYYRFFGVSPHSQAERYRADFRRMTESFARK